MHSLGVKPCQGLLGGALAVTLFSFRSQYNQLKKGGKKDHLGERKNIDRRMRHEA